LISSELLEQFKLCIADIIIQFIADDNVGLLVPDSHYPFLVNQGQPDLCIRVHYGPLPELKLEKKLFNSGAVWALYRSNGAYEITFSSDIRGASPYQVAVINSNFSTGDLYVRPINDSERRIKSGKNSNSDFPVVAPTAYPLDEVFMANLLSRGRGVEFHACGVRTRGQGMIFTGTSGAGKSTISRLWQGKKDATVLSDERIIVRWIDGKFWMFGTPWYSDAAALSPERAPLENIFLINHSPDNYTLPLRASDAASRLFVRCFPTFWDEAGLAYTLGLISQITEKVPCYELGFVPDESVLDFVNEINPGGGRIEAQPE